MSNDVVDDLTLARADAAQELANALCLAAGDVMKRHGHDPEGLVVLTAGFSMALKSIGQNIDPRVPMLVHALLTEP